MSTNTVYRAAPATQYSILFVTMTVTGRGEGLNKYG